MNSTWKRISALVLTMVMVFGMLPVSAFADECEHSYGEDNICTLCGAEQHVHSFGEGAVTTEPTCVAAGVLTKTCDCGATETEEIAATGEHVYGEDGKCTCGAEKPAEHTHEFGEGTVTTEATCAASGVLTKTCECGETATEVIPATGNHNYVDGVCTGCTAVETPQPEHTHEWNEGEVTLEALCTDTGVMTYTCQTEGCGETKTETILAQCTDEVHAWECPYNLENPANRCTLTEGCQLLKGHEELGAPCDVAITFDDQNILTLEDLKSALENSSSAAIKLGADITTNEILKIERAVTIDLNDKTITGSATKVFEVHANTTIKGGSIVNTASGGRCVDTRTNVELVLYNVTLTATGTNSQPLTVGGSKNGTKVTVTDSAINAGTTGYGIIVFVNSDIDVSGGSVTGYNALYMKGGSNGSTVDFTNCAVSSVGAPNYDSSNTFGTIVLEDSCNITVTGGSVTAKTTNDNIQSVLLTKSVTGAVVNLSATTVSIEGNAAKYISADVFNNSVSLPASVNADALKAEGYELVGSKVVEIINNEDALRRAVANGGTITLEGDITLTETLTIPQGKTVTLNLNNHKIEGALQANSSERHIYVIDNYGTLTIEGTGTISGRGTQNYGTMTIEDGVTINSVDDNGGACVWNYAGASLTINGGTFNVTQDGTYNAANTTNPWGAGGACIHGSGAYTLDIDGGIFTSAAKGVYAICAKGTTTIDNAIVSGIHGAISVTSSATIGSGTYSITGVDAQTDHCIYVPEGASVTISNGSFTGDNGEAGGKVLCVEGTATVTGGTFKKSANSVSDVSEFVALYYKQDPTTGTVNPVPEVKPEAAAPTVSNKVDESTLTTEEKAVEDKIPEDTNINEAPTVTNSITNVLNNDESVKQIIENLDTPGATGVEMSLDIERKDVQVEGGSATEEGTTKLVYEVQPYIQPIDDAENPVGAPTEVNTVSESITFRLPMPNGTKGRVVKVTHDHDGNGHEFFGNYKIQGTDEGETSTDCYVELSSKQFSEYVVEILPESVSTISTEVNGTPYATLADALAAATSGQTIKFLEDITLGAVSEMSVPAGVTIDGNSKKISVESVAHYVGANALFYSDGAFNVQDLTISLTGAESGAAAISFGNGGTADNVTVEGGFMHGIKYANGNVSITNCTFKNNNSADGTYGVYSENAPTGTVTIEDNTFETNRAAVLRSNETFSGNTVSSTKGVSVTAPNAKITDNTFTGNRALSISGSGSTSTITGNSFSTTTKVETEVDADLSNNYWGSANGPSASQIVNEKPGEATVIVNSYYTDDDMKQNDLTAGDDAVAYYNGAYYNDLNDAAKAANGQPIYLVLSKPSTTTLTYPATIDNLGLNGTLGVSLSTEASVTVTSSGEVVIAPPANVVGYYPFISLKYGKDSVDVQAIFVEPGTKLSITSTTSEFDDAAFSGEFMKDLNKNGTLEKGDFKAYFPTYDNRYVKGTDETLIVESTGFFGTCLQIFVDDIEIYDAADGYEKSGVDVKVGCTRLELTSKFLKTLSTGDYTVTFVHKLGNETFKVSETIKIRDDSSKADPTNPKTGDFILMPMAIMTLSAAALAVLLMGKKKMI